MRRLLTLAVALLSLSQSAWSGGSSVGAIGAWPNAPFGIPASGYVGYLYKQNNHAGLDICFKQNCPSETAATSAGPGNPVYSAYSGTLVAVYSRDFTSVAPSSPLAAIVVLRHDNVPGASTSPVYTWYLHMADEFSTTSYVNSSLILNTSYPAGFLLGHQGNRRILNPQGQPIGDIVTHLHFQVQTTSANVFLANSLDPSPFLGPNVNYGVTSPPHLVFGDLITTNLVTTQPSKLVIYTANAAGARLPGACYRIHQDAGNGVLGAYVTGMSQCDHHDATPDDGHVEFSGLPAGNYVLLESRAPSGYYLAAKWRFHISAGQRLPKTIVNDPGGSQLAITTTSVSGAILTGACFNALVSIGSNQWEGRASACDNYDAINGVSIISGLRPGTYLLSESQAPSGYLGAANTTLTIPSGGGTVKVTVRDRPVNDPASATITTQDASGHTLVGACYGLFKDAGGGAIGSHLAGTCDWPSDGLQNGKTIFFDVAAGNYVLIESRSPVGYQVGAKIRFTKASGSPAQIKVIDQPGGASIQVKTVNSATNQVLLGVCYQVQKNAGGGKVGDFVTGGCDGGDGYGPNDGTWRAEGLPAGSYILIQGTRPSGFNHAPNRTFSVAAGQSSVALTVPTQPTAAVAAASTKSSIPSVTATATATLSATMTQTATSTPGATVTPIATDTPTLSPTATATSTETATPTETATATETATPTETATATETPIVLPTDTPSATPEETVTETADGG